MDHSMQHDTERPAKRPCLSYTHSNEEEAPPDFDLPAARAQNDSRLKSLFEGIFAKYSQDFTNVGDEIDLATGDIVVDNGHLLGLQDEDDPNEGGTEGTDGEHGDDDEDTKGEEFFSVTSSPCGTSPTALDQGSASLGQPKDGGSSLDFVFTFKSSGATGLSPTTKDGYGSRPTKPVAISKPQDPLWTVPDLPPSLSTPTIETRKTNVFMPSTRSPSPPGSGSVWAVRQARRPRTETKPKSTPSKRRPAVKRKYHSSPVTHDWSFAAIPDGNESDDPLQDYEPSPTPSKMQIIRGKRRVPTKDHDGPSTKREQTPPKQPEPAMDEDPPNGQAGDQEHHSQGNKVPDKDKALSLEIDAQHDTPLKSVFQESSTPKASIEAPSPQPSTNTPSKKQPITPDEGKLIVCMMHRDRKKAIDVVNMLPHRDYQGVWHWFYYHWTRRLANPPALSSAWSQPELAALSRLSARSGLTWNQLQHEFKGRTRNEVEFEFLRAFVGEGFSSPTEVDTEEHGGEEGYGVEMQKSKEENEAPEQIIKEETESEGFDKGFDQDIRRDSSDQTMQPGHEEVNYQEGNVTHSKAFIPNSLLGIFIDSCK